MSIEQLGNIANPEWTLFGHLDLDRAIDHSHVAARTLLPANPPAQTSKYGVITITSLGVLERHVVRLAANTDRGDGLSHSAPWVCPSLGGFVQSANKDRGNLIAR